MAKISFNKLTPVKKLDAVSITIGEQEIIVNQYLPLEEKSSLIEKVLAQAVDGTGFYSPIRLDVMFHIELIRAYTNISITDKMMEDPGKVYDLLVLNNILEAVIPTIPQEEYDMLLESVSACAEQVMQYSNSFMGMLRAAKTDFTITDENITKMMNTLHDPEAVGLVQEVLKNLG
jgi:hypothetical protein